MQKIQIILFLLINISTLGQEVETVKQLQVIGFISEEKVLLRWTPNNYISWQRGNQFGYSVFRKAVMRNGKAIDKPDSIFIGTFNPFPLVSWNRFADSSHFAVAAEAIYGKEFEITTQSKNILSMVNISKEQDRRFSIGLLCADQSFTVACMMGLGLVDATVKKNEAYIYMVVSNYNDPSQAKETGYAMVDFNFGNFTPRPFGIQHEVVENIVTIILPYDPFKGIYNTFEIQRSEDGKTYHTIKDKSNYSLSTTVDDPKYNIYNDSVNSLSTMVYYRLRGKTSFDLYGPYSDTLIVNIMPSLNGEPWITNIKEIGNGNITVNWEIPEYKKDNLKGFMICSSKNYEGPYFNNLNSPVDPQLKRASINAPKGFAYIKVSAIDRFNRSYFSTPRLYQMIDSIPPVEPKGLTGAFDTTGVVNLNWNYGKEKDILGYQVLYSANAKSEYSLISKGFIYDSTYRTTFPANVLSSDLFFKVVALDIRYNSSKASDPLRLTKPDKVPPSAPVILLDSINSRLLCVKIVPSSSSDVDMHYLYFLPDKDNSEKMELFKGKIKVDTSMTLMNKFGRGSLYCVAEDISRRKSISNKLLINQNISNSIDMFNSLAKPLVDEGAVELIWDNTKLSGNIMIYRKDAESSYRLISTVESQRGVYKDKNVTINTNYKYKLVAFDRNGKPISNSFKVKYQ